MAGNDISSLIQDIYDRYNENQKDKKPEEQMYMSEEEFKSNLKTLVNKSPIEDKFMLYREIYLQITEDALEIDTTGNITISPKVIVNAEKEVIRRLEEQKNGNKTKIGAAEIIAGKTILDMTKEEYDKLTYEQKRDLFADSMAELYGSKDDARNAYNLMENTAASNEGKSFFDNLREKVNKGQPLDETERNTIFSEEEMNVTNVQYQKMVIDLEQNLAFISNSEYASLFTTQGENGKKYWSQEIIQTLYELSRRDDYSEESIIEKLNSIFEDEKSNTPDEKKVGLALNLVKDKNLIAAYAKAFHAIASIRNNSREALRGTNGEICNGIAGMIVDNKDNFQMGIDLKATLEKLKEMCGIILSGKVTENDLNRFEVTYQSAVKTNQWVREKDKMIANIVDLKKVPSKGVEAIVGDENKKSQLGEVLKNVTQHSQHHKVTLNMVGSEQAFGAIKDIKIPELRRTPDESLVTDVKRVFDGINAARKDIDLSSLSQQMNGTPKEKSFQEPTDNVPKEDTVKKEELVEETVEIDGVEEDFEASLAAISDMEPDMFAGMFDAMAEEMVIEEEPVREEDVVEKGATETVLTEEGKESQTTHEATAPVIEPVNSGMQVEEIAVNQDLTPEKNEELLPKKITWVDRIKATVNSFGKNVKKAFGDFVNAITGKGGESNNSGGNNTTTGTSSNAGQDKPVQEVNNFIPTAALDIKQAQQAVARAAEEAKKNDPGRATEDPTQDELGG